MDQPPRNPNTFVTPPPFPVDAVDPDRPRRPAGRGIFTSYVLPVVLFVVIVGVTAWVVQNMPKWRTPNAATTPDNNSLVEGKGPIEFVSTKAVWEKDSDYVREFERGVPGHYDFLFKNVAPTEAELGLFAPSCDCVSIQASLLDKQEFAKLEKAQSDDPSAELPYTTRPAWQNLEQSRDSKLIVPAEGSGVVRVNWNGRKDPGRQLNLTPKIWFRSADKAERYGVPLTVPIVMVAGLNFSPDRVSVGQLGPGAIGKGEFFIWSVTRDNPDVSVKMEPPDPLVEVQTRRMERSELDGLSRRLEDDGRGKQRVKSAYHVNVVVHEKKGDREMELGPFIRDLTLYQDELPYGAKLRVTGIVRGEVDVGSGEEPGKIKLKPFSVKLGTREVFPMWSDAKVNLEPFEQTPAGVEVKLSKLPKESTAQRTKWRLEVIVPPDAVSAGALGEESAIILRVNSTPPRLVRVPIIGNALAD
jgi:hypothetical protein